MTVEIRQSVLQLMVSEAMIACYQQLAIVAMNKNAHFDFKAIFTSMINAVMNAAVSSKITINTQTVQAHLAFIASDISKSLLGSAIYGASPRMHSFFVNVLAQETGRAVNAGLNTYLNRHNPPSQATQNNQPQSKINRVYAEGVMA